MPPAAAADHYSTLGVGPDASSAAIKRAYRAAAREAHPDKLPSASAESLAAANQRLAALNTAYSVLKDEDKRRLYDLQREEQRDEAWAGGAGRFSTTFSAPWRAARTVLIGRAAGAAFAPWSEVFELSKFNVGRLQLQKRTTLVYVYLHGSARCERAAREIRRAAAILRGVVQVVALNAETEAELTQALGAARDGDESPYPRLILLRGGKVQAVPPPHSAGAIIAIVAESLPEVPVLCSKRSIFKILESSAGAAIASPNLPGVLLDRLRVTCVFEAKRHRATPLRCGMLVRSACEGADVLAGCAGVALLDRDGKLIRCIVGAEADSFRQEQRDNARVDLEEGAQTRHGASGTPNVAYMAAADAMSTAVAAHAGQGRAAKQVGNLLGPSIALAGSVMTQATRPFSRVASRAMLALSNAPAGRVLLRAEALPLVLALALVAWWTTSMLAAVVRGLLWTVGRARWVRRAKRRVRRSMSRLRP